MAYSVLEVEVTGKWGRLEQALGKADNAMRQFVNKNRNINLTINPRVYQQIDNVRRMLGTINGMVIPVEMTMNGESVVTRATGKVADGINKIGQAADKANQSVEALAKQEAAEAEAAARHALKILTLQEQLKRVLPPGERADRLVSAVGTVEPTEIAQATLMVKELVAETQQMKNGFAQTAEQAAKFERQVINIQEQMRKVGISEDVISKYDWGQDHIERTKLAVGQLINETRRLAEEEKKANLERNKTAAPSTGPPVYSGVGAEPTIRGGTLRDVAYHQAVIEAEEREAAELKRLDGVIKESGAVRKDYNRIMQQSQNLILGVGANTERHIKDLEKANKAAHAEQDKVNKSMGRGRDEAQGLGRAFAELTNTVRRFVIGYFAVSGLIAVFRKVKEAAIDYNGIIDKARLTLTALFGSTKIADKLIGQMETLAALSPFQFQDLLPFTQRLAQAGRSVNTLAADMKALGDFVSLRGIGTEGFQRIIYNLQQMRELGRVSGRELRDLSNSLVPAVDILAKAWGVNTQKMQEWISKGIVPGDKAIDALIKGMGKYPGAAGAMERESSTLAGGMSNLWDAFNRLVGKGLRPLYDELNRVAQQMVLMSQPGQANSWADDLSEKTKTAIIFVKALVREVDNLKGVLVALTALFAGAKLFAGLTALAKLPATLATISEAGAGGAGLAGILGTIAGFAANPYVIALIGGALIVGGLAYWLHFKGVMKEVADEQKRVAQTSKDIAASLKVATDAAAGNEEATKLINKLAAEIKTARGDTDKLREALTDLANANYEIHNLKLAPGMEQVLINRVRDLRKTLQDELDRLQPPKVLPPGWKQNWDWTAKPSPDAPGPGNPRRISPLAPMTVESAQPHALYSVQWLDRLNKAMAQHGKDLKYLQNIYKEYNAAVKANVQMTDLEQAAAAKLNATIAAQAKGKALYSAADLLSQENDKKAKAAALKREKDRLQDAAALNEELAKQAKQSYEQMAKDAEASARRQLAALKSVKDILLDIFGSVQDELAKFGVFNSPLDAIVSRIEKLVNLGPRMVSVAGGAITKINDLNAASAAQQKEYLDHALHARMALDKATGGDGSEPARAARLANISGGARGAGGAVPAWLLQMEAASGKNFGRNCAEEITARLTAAGVQVGRISGKSMADAWKVGLDANGMLPPGTIVRILAGKNPGQVGNRAGHYAAIGSDMAHWTESNVKRIGNVKHDNISDDRPIDWNQLRNDLARGSAVAFAPPGSVPMGNRVGKVAGALGAASGMGNAAALVETGEFVKDLLDMLNDLSLTKLSAPPKEWGPVVKEAADNAIVFKVQMLLADTATQNMLKTYLGEGGFKVLAKDLREYANQAQYTVNRLQAMAEAQSQLNDLAKAARLRGREDDPFAQLQEEVTRGKLKNADASKLQALADATLRNVLDNNTQSMKDSVRASDDRLKVLAAGRKFIKDATVDEAGYARAVELRGKEVEYWSSDNVRAILREADAREQKSKAILQEVRLYQELAKTDFGRGLLEDSGIAPRDLEQMAQAARKLQIQANTSRADANKSARGILGSAAFEYDVKKADDLARSLAAARQELDRTTAALSAQVPLLNDAGLSEQALSDALESQAYYLQQLNRLHDERGGDVTDEIRNLAAELTARNDNNRAMARQIELARETRRVLAETAAATELSRKKQGVYGSTVFGSVEQQRQLKELDDMAALQRRVDAGEFTTTHKGAISPRSGKKIGTDFTTFDQAAYDAALKNIQEQAKAEGNLAMTAQQAGAIFEAQNALTQAQLALREKGLEISGALNDVTKAQNQLEAEMATRLAAGIPMSEKELELRRAALVVLGQTIALQRDEDRRKAAQESRDKVASMQDQIAALGMRGTDSQRDAFLRRGEYERTIAELERQAALLPPITTAWIDLQDQIARTKEEFDMGEQVAQAQEAAATIQAAFQAFTGIVTDSFHAAYEASGGLFDRILAGVGAMIDGIANYFLQLAEQILATYLVLQLFDAIMPGFAKFLLQVGAMGGGGNFNVGGLFGGGGKGSAPYTPGIASGFSKYAGTTGAPPDDSGLSTRATTAANSANTTIVIQNDFSGIRDAKQAEGAAAVVGRQVARNTDSRRTNVQELADGVKVGIVRR